MWTSVTTKHGGTRKDDIEKWINFDKVLSKYLRKWLTTINKYNNKDIILCWNVNQSQKYRGKPHIDIT